MSWTNWNKLFPVRVKGGDPLPASFKGWPATEKIVDPDHPQNPGIQVYDGCLSPGGARGADILSTLLSFAVAGDMIILSIQVETLEFFLPAMGGVVGLYYASRTFFRWLLARAFWMRVFEDRIETATWSDFTTYKTNVGYSFRLEDHERAFDEDLQTRQNPRVDRYYSNSKRVMLDHGRQGIFLAEVYPKEKANRFLGRLAAIQHGFDLGIFK